VTSKSMQSLLGETISYKLARPSLLTVMIMLIYGFNSAVGTTLYMSSWYYIIPAVSWVDLMVFFNFLVLLANKRQSFVIATSRIEKVQAQLLVALSALLITSVFVNAFSFKTDLGDLLPALKLLYFVIIINVIKKYSDRFGASYLIIGFLLGVAAVAMQSYSLAENYIFPGVPVLWDPNVTGALLGMGIFFAALLVLIRKNVAISMMFALVFCAVSLFTWSKAAWLMCGTSLLIFSIFLLSYSRKYKRGKRVTSGLRLLFVVLFFLAMLAFFSVNKELISVIIEKKLESTLNINSVTVRFNLIIASIFAAADNPFLGLGYRNFFYVHEYLPNLDLLDPTQLEHWNAHNVFFQILAVGGIPAFLVLLTQFITPFIALRRALSEFYSSGFRLFVAIFLVFCLWFLYGSVQMLLVAQPPFWFFCGIVFSLCQVDSGKS